MSIESLSLLIKPVGADCNLRCGYCFYLRAGALYPKTSGPMEDAVLEALIEKFLAIPQAQSALSWQGGEPTTAGLPFFEKVIELEQRFGRAGQSVANSLQTNGVLIDDEWAAFLKKWNWLVGISIDGPKEVHEFYRGPYHDRVVDAAKILMRRGVPVNVLSVVSNASVGRAAEVYGFLRSIGFNFLQFIPCVEWDHETGEILDCSVGAAKFGEFMCEIFDLWRAEPEGTVSVRHFEALAAAALGMHRPLCSFNSRCADYLLIERTGDVYPCDFFAYPQWRLGNITEDEFEALAESPLRQEFAHAKENIAPECEACRYLHLCYGGCMKDRPAFPEVTPDRTRLCEGYEMLFEHVGDYFERFAERRRREIERVRSAAASPGARPRPNAPCPCGSGKKFKHCCGRGR